MAVLKWLAQFRSPFWDQVVGTLTYLGDETFFIIIGLVLFWCVSKKWGYRMLAIGLFGTLTNQLLKAIFLVPRPWVLDPNFTIVESAREAASGYSFPSGHTQSVACVFGTLAAWLNKKWTTVVCIVLILAVGFSRMYLGVHTPWDVGVLLVTGAVTVLGFLWLYRWAGDCRKRQLFIWMLVAAMCLALIGYVSFAPVTERNIAEFDAHAVDSAWKLLGALAGMILAWWVDEKHTHFEVKAVWWVQVLKLVIGFGLTMGIRSGLKPVLAGLLPSAALANAIRYFLMVAAAGVLWPMTFKYWAKLGVK